jgi:hypothetical protein
MLGICDRITDNVLQEDLENATSLLVDQTGNTFHTATTSETANSLRRSCFNNETKEHRRGRTYGFSDTLNVVTKDLTVALSTALAQTLRRRYGQHHCDMNDKACRAGRFLVSSL